MNKLNDKNAKKNNKLLCKWVKKNNNKHKPNKDKKVNILNNDLIVLKNVNKYVLNGNNCTHILKDINLTIKKGEFVVIYGQSGSGKTTLLSIISGLDRPTDGYSYLFGKNSICLSNSQLTTLRKKNIGYIFQQYGLLKHLNVYENIKINSSFNLKKSSEIIDKLLIDVGLIEYKKSKIQTLSGGQAQRVSICRALVKQPLALFADEPTGALHIDGSVQVLKIFKKINFEYKTTIILVTHNEKMLSIADRIIRIDDGKIVEDYYNNKVEDIENIDW